jgi:1-acyl-sn-glycerol-3-phosphate acyltransferase
MNRLLHIIRTFTLVFCFFWFGVGGIVLGCVVLPVLRLCTRGKRPQEHRTQHTISLSFRLFLGLMASTRNITFTYTGFEKLNNDKAHLIIANHPTLIDYVAITSQLKHCYNIVKADAANNPFMKPMIQGAGYVSNADPEAAFTRIQDLLNNGQNLLIFPEGTRTTPGKPIKCQRGAAHIALRLQLPITVIRIRCLSGFLTKHEKWYTVPREKVYFDVEVLDDIDITPFLKDDMLPSIAARRLTQLLEETLSA